ncbi:acyl-CoA thioesterase [Rathayibacter sp. YIM 133350]|uniref:acyl-CoA thioesterase n=1 Tax=Rathayibacter sp. YIM 133350 TaxID=3131992 RepID=UPI00307D15E0
MFFRTIFHIALARLRRPIGIYDVSRSWFRTLPTDQDVLGHMNNGVYFSIMDIARFDQTIRSGTWDVFRARGWYPVVVSETLSFRKSLTLGQRFAIESRILGFDDKAVYVEQRFVRPDADGRLEVYAKGYIRGRFLKKTGGTVPIAEVIEASGGIPEGLEVPQRLLDWGQAVQLPATRAAAPSLWL